MVGIKISKKIFKLSLFLFFGLIIFLTVSSCSKGNLNLDMALEDLGDNTLTRINDMPFVAETKVDIEKSLILGEGKSWSGQLHLKTPANKNEVFNFYVNNLQDFGWKEQTTIRGATSVLNFVGENNRVAIITVKELRFNNSEVIISVSPYTEEFEEKIGEFINEKYLEITD